MIIIKEFHEDEVDHKMMMKDYVCDSEALMHCQYDNMT